MPKKAYIICYNHMDPVWRRGFENHFSFEGHVIRPYSDIEEAQFDQWLQIVQNSDCIYSIEQSFTVKKYLERNPDKFALFKRLVQEGKLVLFGAGETIIDTNMVHGESIVRNHLYSIMWYKAVFGLKPANALATDTFGLSAQLPQIFRQFGYTSLLKYDYTFVDAKPFWKGLNGDLLYIRQTYADLGAKNLIINDWIKYMVCTGCKGEGCDICHFTGMDYTYKSNSMEYPMESYFKQMQEAEENTFLVSITSEETLKTPDFIEQIAAYSKLYGIDLKFTTFNEMIHELDKPRLDALITGNIDPQDIDPRTEGNPFATGCYISRIELKKLNRRLESMLLGSEMFAAYALDYDMDYPRKKIERLWNQMAFMQFHDCITGSHVDEGYRELVEVGRNVALGAAQIGMEAIRSIEQNIGIPAKQSYRSIVVFNPLNWVVKDHILEAVIEIDKNEQIAGLTLEEPDGTLLEVLDFTCVNNQKNTCLKIRFRGGTLPPLGYKVFYFKLAGAKILMQEHIGNYIENEYYRIQIGSHGITSIYDKELEHEVVGDGAGDLVIVDDWGSPWNTLAPPFFSESIANPYYLEYVTQRDYQVETKKQQIGGRQVFTIQGSYVNRERNVTKLLWKQEVTIYQGIKKVFFKTDIDWDAANQRLEVVFPLGFKTKDDEAYYEIPFGTLKRKSYKGQYDFQGAPSGDWPALNFVSCHHPEKNYSVTLFNKGLPCHRVTDGTIRMGLLRSPGHPAGAMFAFDGARDQGQHTFEYMITSNKGKLKEGRVVQTGIEFNTLFPNCQGTIKEGDLGLEHSFMTNQSDNIVITSIKRAEASDHLVIRAYEAYGDVVVDSFTGFEDCGIMEVNLLEEPVEQAEQIQYNGFDIKTFKIV